MFLFRSCFSIPVISVLDTHKHQLHPTDYSVWVWVCISKLSMEMLNLHWNVQEKCSIVICVHVVWCSELYDFG